MKACMILIVLAGALLIAEGFRKKSQEVVEDSLENIYSAVSADACTKWGSVGYHSGTYELTFQSSEAPNGREWTWRQCAARCASERACEFWALQLSGKKQCMMMSNKGAYHEGALVAEGPTDLSCLADASGPSQAGTTVGPSQARPSQCSASAATCTKWGSTGYHSGTYELTLQSSEAPNGRGWTWRQCAVRCVAENACEFWALQLSGNGQCMMMSNKGSYHEGASIAEGPKDATCLAEPGKSTISVIDEYKAIDKTIYVWNIGDKVRNYRQWEDRDIKLLVSVCKAHNFTRAIVFVGSIQWDWDHFKENRLPNEAYFVALFAALRLAGVKTTGAFYLNDDPNLMDGAEKAVDVVSAFHAFNVAHPASAVVGIDGDQEPNKITAAYQTMNANMRARRDDLGASFAIAASLKPGWLNKEYDGTSMAGAALVELDEGMIMAYSNVASTSMRYGDISLSLGVERSRPVSVAIEVSPRPPSPETFWGVASGADKESFFQMIVDMDENYRHGPYCSAYRDLVIHDYEGFFEAMYGTKATQFPSDEVMQIYGGS